MKWLLLIAAAQALQPPSSKKLSPQTKFTTLEQPEAALLEPRLNVNALLADARKSPLFGEVDAQLERLTKDPQALLEAVVGLPAKQTAREAHKQFQRHYYYHYHS